jgi:hypothetical protein
LLLAAGDNVTLWALDHPHSGELIICHPVAPGFCLQAFCELYGSLFFDCVGVFQVRRIFSSFQNSPSYVCRN